MHKHENSASWKSGDVVASQVHGSCARFTLASARVKLENVCGVRMLATKNDPLFNLDVEISGFSCLCFVMDTLNDNLHEHPRCKDPIDGEAPT